MHMCNRWHPGVILHPITSNVFNFGFGKFWCMKSQRNTDKMKIKLHMHPKTHPQLCQSRLWCLCSCSTVHRGGPAIGFFWHLDFHYIYLRLTGIRDAACAGSSTSDYSSSVMWLVGTCSVSKGEGRISQRLRIDLCFTKTFVLKWRTWHMYKYFKSQLTSQKAGFHSIEQSRWHQKHEMGTLQAQTGTRDNSDFFMIWESAPLDIYSGCNLGPTPKLNGPILHPATKFD